MPHTDDFYRWNQTVQEQFTELKPHHRTSLAEYAFGMILAECCEAVSLLLFCDGCNIVRGLVRMF